MLQDILDRLAVLPKEQKEQVVRDALQATSRFRWIPNPGPQTSAYDCEADELFFGGQAGGGKSDLGIGLALTAHQRSLVLREFNEDARSLGDRLLEIVGSNDGWNGQLLRYAMGGRLVELAGLPNEKDKQRHKGDPHDLICVERGTPVLMSGGTYRPVESLVVGDLLQTLEGPRRLQRAYPLQRKPCVAVIARDADGREIARQVQSVTHSLLCEDGWFSAVDLGVACGPMECRDSDTPGQSCPGRSAGCGKHHLESIGRLMRMDVSTLPFLSNLCDVARRVFGALSGQQTDCAEFACGHAGERLLPLSSCHVEPCAPVTRLFSLGVGARVLLRASRDVLSASSLRDWLGRCWFGTRPCDARIRRHLGFLSGAAVGQRCLLLRDDVVPPIPSHWREDDPARTQTRSHQRRTYAHPYTGGTRQVDQSGSLLCAALECVPVGARDVFDLQVEEVNHYITGGGFINKNCFDEVGDFFESQYSFIIGWNRSTKPGQRCRVVATGNPPTRAKGLWVIKRWAAWLDPNHPKPARDGELRWYTSGEDGNEIEVDGPGPHLIDGEPVMARSRTFIRSKLSDNPDLAKTNYDANLAALPKELRDAYRGGKFDLSLRDDPWQVIPTAWIREAQRRWTSMPPKGVPLCAIGVDVAAGGADNTVLSKRHDSWFAPLLAVPGVQTPLGSDVAGLIFSHLRDDATVCLDMGGGYGSGPYETLHGNGVRVYPYKGAESASGRTRDGKLAFVNKRSEACWRFREALDPDQMGGSPVMLPEDPELVADLTALTFEVTPHGIKVIAKEKLVESLGRSTDKGDAVIMSWYVGDKMGNIRGGFAAGKKSSKELGVNLGKRFNARNR